MNSVGYSTLFEKNVRARGGSTIIEINDKVLIFGGADREQNHFQDLIVYDRNTNQVKFWEKICLGDIPMARSGHSVSKYGKYMFLFGGIDFMEEAVYNDLYILDTDSYTWHYVGESGIEITARNSHSMGIVRDPSNDMNYLIIFGGASPEHGPMKDCYYSPLPPCDQLDTTSIHVVWKEVELFNSEQRPSKREMHSSSIYNDESLVISGGRSETGELLRDVWSFQIASNMIASNEIVPSTIEIINKPSKNSLNSTLESNDQQSVFQFDPLGKVDEVISTSKAPEQFHIRSFESDLINTITSIKTKEEKSMDQSLDQKDVIQTSPILTNDTISVPSTGVKFQWNQLASLPTPRCAHGSSILQNFADLTQPFKLVVFGGFTSSGISDELWEMDLSPSQSWRPIKLTQSIDGRFGLCMCSISLKATQSIVLQSKYGPLFKKGPIETLHTIVEICSSTNSQIRNTDFGTSILIFGGVNIDKDYGEIWNVVVK